MLTRFKLSEWVYFFDGGGEFLTTIPFEEGSSYTLYRLDGDAINRNRYTIEQEGNFVRVSTDVEGSLWLTRVFRQESIGALAENSRPEDIENLLDSVTRTVTAKRVEVYGRGALPRPLDESIDTTQNPLARAVKTLVSPATNVDSDIPSLTGSDGSVGDFVGSEYDSDLDKGPIIASGVLKSSLGEVLTPSTFNALSDENKVSILRRFYERSTDATRVEATDLKKTSVRRYIRDNRSLYRVREIDVTNRFSGTGDVPVYGILNKNLAGKEITQRGLKALFHGSKLTRSTNPITDFYLQGMYRINTYYRAISTPALYYSESMLRNIFECLTSYSLRNNSDQNIVNISLGCSTWRSTSEFAPDPQGFFGANLFYTEREGGPRSNSDFIPVYKKEGQDTLHGDEIKPFYGSNENEELLGTFPSFEEEYDIQDTINLTFPNENGVWVVALPKDQVKNEAYTVLDYFQKEIAEFRLFDSWFYGLRLNMSCGDLTFNKAFYASNTVSENPYQHLINNIEEVSEGVYEDADYVYFTGTGTKPSNISVRIRRESEDLHIKPRFQIGGKYIKPLIPIEPFEITTTEHRRSISRYDTDFSVRQKFEGEDFSDFMEALLTATTNCLGLETIAHLFRFGRYEEGFPYFNNYEACVERLPRNLRALQVFEDFRDKTPSINEFFTSPPDDFRSLI